MLHMPLTLAAGLVAGSGLEVWRKCRFCCTHDPCFTFPFLSSVLFVAVVAKGGKVVDVQIGVSATSEHKPHSAELQS